MEFLIVTKDIMSQRTILPIVRGLMAQGHHVEVLAEGKSVALWHQAEIQPLDDAESSPEAILRDLAPRVVLAGCSTPINLEERVGALANQAGIPLVVFSDTWGAWRRHRHARPDLVMVTDQLDADMASEAKAAGTVVVGDPLVNEIAAPPTHLEETLRHRAQGRKIIFVAGQGLDYTGEVTSLVFDSLGRDWDAYLVAPALIHPKYKGDSRADQILQQLDAVPKDALIEDWGGTSDQMAQLADATISVFSNVLKLSALANKLPVSVITDGSRAGMEQSTGLSRYPLVNLAAALEVRTSAELADLLRGPKPATVTKSQRSYARSIQFNLELAVQSLESLG